MPDGASPVRFQGLPPPEGLVAQPGPASTSLYWWPVPQVRPVSAPEVLTLRERRRVTALPPGPGATYASARTGTRILLAALLDEDPYRLVLRRARCPLCGSLRHGPPEVATPRGPAPLRIALTHTAGVVLLATSTAHRPGVDAEVPHRSPAPPSPAMLRLLSEPVEAARITSANYLRAWTRKEAISKAMGVGLGIPLPALRVRPEHESPLEIRVPPGPWSCVWRVDDLRCPLPGAEGTVAALATPGRGNLQGRRRPS
ncbi:4'-phosphopantetheinyl transferase family protein [Streptomyces sp. NPDC087440]|uniref:4'-phosphopantetheinyl transferase family protein n=1 Tax=Streptomyces sp. NPDC087440 TaxID=3365790 RepID=UPI00380ED267